MKTLVFQGSPKRDGDTAALVHALTSRLSGEVKTVSCDSNIRPCNDCRYCWDHIGCSIRDGMQEVYRYLEECDNIVLASPIWFSSLSGPLLNLSSRIQSIWAAGYFQNKTILTKVKNGVILLVGAQPETVETPEKTALGIMKYMNVYRPGVIKIHSLNTNTLPAAQDTAALEKCWEAAAALNRACE